MLPDFSEKTKRQELQAAIDLNKFGREIVITALPQMAETFVPLSAFLFRLVARLISRSFVGVWSVDVHHQAKHPFMGLHKHVPDRIKFLPTALHVTLRLPLHAPLPRLPFMWPQHRRLHLEDLRRLVRQMTPRFHFQKQFQILKSTRRPPANEHVERPLAVLRVRRWSYVRPTVAHVAQREAPKLSLQPPPLAPTWKKEETRREREEERQKHHRMSTTCSTRHEKRLRC